MRISAAITYGFSAYAETKVKFRSGFFLEKHWRARNLMQQDNEFITDSDLEIQWLYIKITPFGDNWSFQLLRN